MHCPFCAHDDTKVNDSRLAAEGTQIRRRRECLACGERFTTFETAELVMPLVTIGGRGSLGTAFLLTVMCALPSAASASLPLIALSDRSSRNR